MKILIIHHANRFSEADSFDGDATFFQSNIVLRSRLLQPGTEPSDLATSFRIRGRAGVEVVTCGGAAFCLVAELEDVKSFKKC